MFLVIPLVEFLHVLGVDINVHHENPATFLCHVSVSSVKRSRHRFASSRWHPVLTPGAQERHETPTGEPFSRHSQIPGLLSAIFRLIEAHRNEIQASLVRSQSFGLLASRVRTRGFASFQAHLCLRRLSHLTPPVCRRARQAKMATIPANPTCRQAVAALSFCLATNGRGCHS